MHQEHQDSSIEPPRKISKLHPCLLTSNFYPFTLFQAPPSVPVVLLNRHAFSITSAKNFNYPHRLRLQKFSFEVDKLFFSKMTLNPAYEAIGKGFVQQYYAMFDDPAQRHSLMNLYNTETSFMTFEGMQLQGAVKIMEKLNSLTFQKINRIITAVDSQPMFDGGILINVLGRLQADEDPPHQYSQIFVLKPVGNSFYCQHDVFRLGIHDSA